jgi:hypothetical protein
MRRHGMVLGTLGVMAWGLACVAPGDTGSNEGAAEALLALHTRILDAHRRGEVDVWLDVEADQIVIGNRGRVRVSPSRASRQPGRAEYLASVEFESYRDRREPMVRVSGDGTLGWVIAEVEIIGTHRETGERMADIWAWVELYERIDGRWRMVGNVSSSRPAESPAGG